MALQCIVSGYVAFLLTDQKFGPTPDKGLPVIAAIQEGIRGIPNTLSHTFGFGDIGVGYALAWWAFQITILIVMFRIWMKSDA